MAASCKVCGVCGEVVSVAGFGVDNRFPDGLKRTCRECEAKRRKELRLVNRQRSQKSYGAAVFGKLKIRPSEY